MTPFFKFWLISLVLIIASVWFVGWVLSYCEIATCGRPGALAPGL